ncbi:hypothetical protein BaRGS_00015797 [Batillaria attramentaria]|uniref:Uncharacterized protein n=1 Tax=Batillaria attramentaria TaxID=370345 RepID=A0ABD0L0Z5_9CAEN
MWDTAPYEVKFPAISWETAATVKLLILLSTIRRNHISSISAIPVITLGPLTTNVENIHNLREDARTECETTTLILRDSAKLWRPYTRKLDRVRNCDDALGDTTSQTECETIPVL